MIALDIVANLSIKSMLSSKRDWQTDSRLFEAELERGPRPRSNRPEFDVAWKLSLN